MSTTLGHLITEARNRHAAFHKTRVGDVVLASYLSDVQRILMSKGSELDSNRMAINCNIGFVTSGANAPGVVGAGTAGGLPGTLLAGVLQTPTQDAGTSIELDDAAVILANDRAVASATALTATAYGAPGWTVNAFVGKVVAIVAGAGTNQRRKILSNTASQVTISSGADGLQWSTTPDTTSVLRIVDFAMIADAQVSLVTELPARTASVGYLIRLDVTGTPFIDISAPVTVVVDNGIQLPPYERMLGGSVRSTIGGGLANTSSPLTIRPYRQRYFWGPSYTCWLEAEKLFLAGTLQDWTNVVSIDLRFVPIPADFTKLTDVMLLPDLAVPAMVAAAAEFMAQRCAGQADSPAVDTRYFAMKKEEADEHYVLAVGATARGVATYVREIW